MLPGRGSLPTKSYNHHSPKGSAQSSIIPFWYYKAVNLLQLQFLTCSNLKSSPRLNTHEPFKCTFSYHPHVCGSINGSFLHIKRNLAILPQVGAGASKALQNMLLQLVLGHLAGNSLLKYGKKNYAGRTQGGSMNCKAKPRSHQVRTARLSRLRLGAVC